MNKHLNHIYVLVVLLVLLPFHISAQDPIGDEIPEVKVIGTVTKDAIMLRWAVNTPLAWKYVNQYGYTLERKTIAIGQEILKDPIVKNITPIPILPKPMMEWESFVEGNENAAIAAQAIYGEDFEVELEEGGNGILNIINLAEALEQRFSFALFAADQDYEVAKYSGLAFVDIDVKPNERYLYTVSTAIPKEKLNVKFGGVYLGLSDYQPLPEPQDFVGVFNDKNVMLSWNFTLLKKQYNNYIIERSDDGNIYKALSDIPIVNLNERKKNPSDRMFYIDSLPQNNKEYHYRLKGISPFGEIGPPSKVISGSGKKPLQHNPAITEAKLLPDNNSARITWEFPEEGLASIDHFELNRSDLIKGNFATIISNISKDKRSIEYSNLNAINYFTITAVGINGYKRVSFPKMVQPVDDTPPSIPIGLTGVIDSTGVVQLSWQKNTEPDFLGYRVFRANLENEEFTQITFKTIPQSNIADTINIKTLNSKVYYKIQAFDMRYNPSGFSEILMLEKPDVIPPTKPVFKSFKADKGVVELYWINSSSSDAFKTLVYRKVKGEDTPWELIAETDLPDNSFKDTTAKPIVVYLYTLVTMDKSGLESEPVTPLTVSLPDNVLKAEIDKFTALVNREEKKIMLTWKYKVDDVVEFSLYKAEEEQKPTLYKVFKNDTNQFTDQNLTVNTKYSYLLQATFSSGAKSPLKKIEVEY
ncbi:fibronectin type III domain-containing protein [Aquimarina mytili]|uniref:Fibronectin type-III domain-containing protein n=1 Tax=Aquimarina mytili TaxID=874423 RepID=A0A936ZVK5_9FLAO|nr:hypothetical protein [Aquimarina mytili]MBL0682718.1 hypothetical protein [Aquimarina mytili]